MEMGSEEEELSNIAEESGRRRIVFPYVDDVAQLIGKPYYTFLVIRTYGKTFLPDFHSNLNGSSKCHGISMQDTYLK